MPIEGISSIYCNNEAVYKNMSIPEYALNKKGVTVLIYFFNSMIIKNYSAISHIEVKHIQRPYTYDKFEQRNNLHYYLL